MRCIISLNLLICNLTPELKLKYSINIDYKFGWNGWLRLRIKNDEAI